MRTIPVAVVLLTLFAGAAAVQAAETDRAISTTGDATVYVVPDRVIVTLGIETYNANLDEAKTANETAAKGLVQAIQGMSIEKKDIATDNLQVEIDRRYVNDDRTQVIRGYFVRRTYAVTLRDTKAFEKLIDTAVKNGANQIHDVSFINTEMRKYRDQARQMAIKAAREKAEALAKELDCKVGKPRAISESPGGYYYYGGRSSRGGNYMAQNSVQVVEGPPDTGENLPLGQIGVSATVSVSFDLQ